MLQKTRGIVISYLRYRETSVIVKIYTEEFGLQSYIENSVRSTKARNKIALFQSLTLLDLVVYHRPDGGLTRLSEVRCHTTFRSLPYNFHKASVAMFLTEVLGKALKEEAGNAVLFAFLFDSILLFDQIEADFENFHLQFLLKLARYLGFEPESAAEIFGQLELVARPQPEETQLLDQLIRSRYGDRIKVSQWLRRNALDYIIAFYRLHVENFGAMKSLSVLQEVMN